MTSPKMHLQGATEYPACMMDGSEAGNAAIAGVKAQGNQTTDTHAVTCKRCLRTVEYKRAAGTMAPVKVRRMSNAERLYRLATGK